MKLLISERSSASYKLNKNKESEMNVQDVSEGTYWIRISGSDNQQVLKKVSITR